MRDLTSEEIGSVYGAGLAVSAQPHSGKKNKNDTDHKKHASNDDHKKHASNEDHKKYNSDHKKFG